MCLSVRRFLFKYLTIIIFCFSSIIVVGQPPVDQPTEMTPNQIDPKTLSQSQLSSLLSDKNKENTGKDRTSELRNKNLLDKDSVIKDNIRLNSYSREQTYGQNIFSNAAVTNLDELSTPPIRLSDWSR